MKAEMNRRQFLRRGCLVLAVVAAPGAVSIFNVSDGFAAGHQPFKPNAYIEMDADGLVTVWVGQTDLGQGTHTGMAMIIAEELDADWSVVTTRMAPAGEAFKDPRWGMQFTGGSTSIRHRWDLLRKAGAAARLMLIGAAAKAWGTTPDKCRTENGRVIHQDGRTAAYASLVKAASSMPVPDNPPLRKPNDYDVIGTSRQRMDIPDKVQGRTVFGIDVQMPGMCIAVVARPPRYGATPDSFNEEAARSVRGVLEVIPVGDRVAVCAETTYAALQGRDRLAVKWSAGSHPELDTAAVENHLEDDLKRSGSMVENTGDAEAALREADRELEAVYRLPYLSHAQLEPTNCTAHVEENRCRIWAPTQGQTGAQMTAAALTGLPADDVIVMTTACGGGFGRRGETDVIEEAVILSKAMKRPVKVMWTREDDFTHDVYRPGSISHLRGGIKDGRLTAWSHRLASPSIMARVMPDSLKNGVDHSSVEGVPDMDYAIPNRRMEYVLTELPIPVGWWRSVGYSINTFTVESFMDELAHAAGSDPVRFRLDMMDPESRSHRTLTLLADKAGWGTPVPEGRGRGIALSSCFGSSAAHMAEVSVDRQSGRIIVHKVVCAVDCGPAVYPDAIVAQMEGGVVMGLSAAFGEKVEFANGGVSTENYGGYSLLTMTDVPEIEVHIADSRHGIGGIGEPGLPTVAPAVANAVFDAVGVRLRELPFNAEALKKALA